MFSLMDYHLGPGRNVGKLKAPGKAGSNSLFLKNTSIFNGSCTKQRISYNGIHLTFLSPWILRSQWVSAGA